METNFPRPYFQFIHRVSACPVVWCRIPDQKSHSNELVRPGRLPWRLPHPDIRAWACNNLIKFSLETTWWNALKWYSQKKGASYLLLWDVAEERAKGDVYLYRKSSSATPPN